MKPQESSFGSIRALVNVVPPLTPETHCSKLHESFRSADTETLVVVDNLQPIGVVSARTIADSMSSQFGFALYSKKSVTEIMTREFQTLDVTDSLARAVEMVFERPREQRYLEFVVLDQKAYCGLLSVGRLLAEQHALIELQMEELLIVNRHLAHNVDELTTTRQSLERAKEEAELANRAKDSFLSTISHELRTPMNGILGMTQLVLDSPLSDDQLDCVQTVKISADLMMSLINHLLDFSRLEAGKLKLENILFPLQETILDALKPLSVNAWNKGLDFDFSMSPLVPATCYGDPLRVLQIISNLLGNAIKFTENGEISLRIALQPDTPETLHVIVSDSGIGISEEQQTAIFEPFIQADASTTRKYGGTGLGLSIVRELTELMKGKLWLKSLPGLGSEFHVAIPVQFGEKNQVVPVPGTATYRGSVFVVRPSTRHREYLDDLIRFWGFRVIPVRTLQAVRGAEEHGNPIVLFDTSRSMATRTLHEEVRRWWSDPAVAEIPVVFLAYRQDDLGFLDNVDQRTFAVVRKPCLPNDLREALCGSQRRATVAQKVAQPIGADGASLRILVAEDNPINALVIEKYLKKVGHHVTLAHDGEQTLELIHASPYDLILMDVHMPGIDGLEATRAIRSTTEGRNQSIPIIAMTADAMPEDRAKCIDAGMSGYISKPVDFHELKDLLLKLPGGRLTAVTATAG